MTSYKFIRIKFLSITVHHKLCYQCKKVQVASAQNVGNIERLVKFYKNLHNAHSELMT